MEPIFGTDVLVSIKVDDTFYPVLCAVDMTLSTRQEVVLATSADTGIWRRKRLRRLSEWSLSVSGLTKIDNTDGQISYFYLLQENVRGTEQTIQVLFEDADGNTKVIEGDVIIPEISINASVGAFSDVNVTFEGAGSFTIADTPEPISSVCLEIYSDTWTMDEGENTINGLGQEGRSFEGKEILKVSVEGVQYDYTSGVPGNREFGYDGTEISVENNAPEGGQKVHVIWKA